MSALSILLVTAFLPQQPADFSIYPGSSSEFIENVRSVEELTIKSDFMKAGVASRMLPKSDIILSWNDAKVPERLRVPYREALDSALEAWRAAIPELKLKVGAGSRELSVSFESELARSPSSNLPLGATLFWGSPEKGPVLEGVIGLNRGRPLSASTKTEVFNEVLFTIGSYLGLTQSRVFGTSMGRTDQPTNYRCQISARERLNARANLQLADLLRKSIAMKSVVAPTTPGLYIEKRAANAGTVVQGEVASINIEVGNRGTGTLRLMANGDCACISATAPERLGPSETSVIKATYHTDDIYGDIRQNVVLYTNDPDYPTILVPVSIKVEPRFRFLQPGGDVVVFDKNPKPIVLYMVPRPGETWVPTKTLLTGIPGKVTCEPWTGQLADPEMKEGAKTRYGYKLTIVPQTTGIPSGRLGVNVTISTTDPTFTRLSHTFFIQKGIIALPESLFFTKGTSTSNSASVLVSRPGRPFKILSVSSKSPLLRATVKIGTRTDEYQVNVKFDSSSQKGDVDSELIIKTDDKDQPTVRVRVGSGG